MKISEITLVAKDMEQILLPPTSLFYGKHKLNPEAEEFLIEETTIGSPCDQVHLTIHLHKDEIIRKDEIAAAVHDHFTYRRKRSERELKRIFQLGWQSLLISIAFLGLLVYLIPLMVRLMPEGGLSLTFREILIILGWVALWRPADFLLYEWRPYKREINLFRKLEECKVEILP
jgi:hypothetical protein